MLNICKLRNDFPLLRDHPSLSYLDNAASALKPDVVIETVDRYYRQLGDRKSTRLNSSHNA